MRIAIVIFVMLLAYGAVIAVNLFRMAYVAGRALAQVKCPEERGLVLEAIRQHRAIDDWTTVLIGLAIEIGAFLLLGVLIEMTGA